MGKTRRFEFPCQLCDTERAERFLEEKALDGWRLKRFCRWFPDGIFEEAAPARVHYRVGLYRRELTREELDSGDFAAYREVYARFGWEYQCFALNLAVFASEREECPPRVQPDQRVPERKLRERAERGDLRALWGYGLAGIVWPVLLFWGMGLFLGRPLGKSWQEAVMMYPMWIAVLAGNLGMAAAAAVWKARFFRIVRRGEELPERAWFWSRTVWRTVWGASLTLGAMVWAINMGRAEESPVFSAAMGLELGLLYWFWRNWKQGRRGQETGAVRGVFLAVLLLLALGIWRSAAGY